MLFPKDLNSKNTFVLSNETEKDLFTPNKSPFSHATTSLSSQDIKKDEDIGISEFPKIIKPTPNYLSIIHLKKQILTIIILLIFWSISK